MTSILNKNAILTGHVDAFCLACENHLRSDEDAVLHIVKPIHKKNLEATSFLEKYKDDHVRKVKKGYYCEYCNVFMKTAAKVGPHVTESKHCERRASQPFKREGNGVLAFGRVFVPENAWHGLTEDTCSVCDAEFDNALLHKTETAHILNLVLAEIEVADGNMFRTVDDSTFQCLTCNLVLALKDMAAHFGSEDHKKLYQECSNAAKKLLNEPITEPEAVKENDQTKKLEDEAPKKETPKKSEEEVSKEEKLKVAPELANANECKKIPETDRQIKTDEKPEPVKKLETEKKTETEKKPETENKPVTENKLETEKKPVIEQKPVTEKKPKTEEKPMTEKKQEIEKKPVPKKKPETESKPVAENKLETEKKPVTEKKPEPVKDKKAATSTKKYDKMGKIDKEISDVLGAVDYIATDVNGKHWCILCDWTMDPSAVEPHLTSKHHQTLLLMHRERAERRNPEIEETVNIDEPIVNGKSEKTSKKVPSKANKVDQITDSKSKIVDAADEFQKNDIKLDLVNGSAYCRVCRESVDYDFEIIKKHIDEHKKANPAKTGKTENLKSFANSTEKSAVSLMTSPVHMNGKEKPKQEKEKAPKEEKKKDATKESETEEIYAKENGLVYNRERNNAFCRICISNVPPALNNMKEHINGLSHINRAAQPKEKLLINVFTKEPARMFINNAIVVESACYKDVVINDKYCLNIFSFFLVTRVGSKFRCHGCEANVSEAQLDDHRNTQAHRSIMGDGSVVTSEESEFIREIRQDVYHCGYCNQVASPWAALEAHARGAAHREAKTAAAWRLQGLAPAAQRPRQAMPLDLFNCMLLAHMYAED